MNRRPLIAHALYSLDTGGMERFAVTLINHTQGRYRHALICLTGFGALRNEIESADVQCVSLDKKPGKDWLYYFRLWRALRVLKPDLVHSYNIGALDTAPIAKLAGVPCIVHAERGRDAADPDGGDRRYRRLRRWMSPFIARYLAVSLDLQSWLLDSVGITQSKVIHIPNGIDATEFVAISGAKQARPLLADFAPPGTTLIVNVSRLDAVKDQAGLIDAFHILCNRDAQTTAGLRLAIIGEGRQRASLEGQIARLDLTSRVRLFGNRNDVPALLGEADIFVLSSIAEGMPGVLLEAMASGLPVVATHVGGVGEVVVDGKTGTLVAPSNPAALAAALGRYVHDLELRVLHGMAGRVRVEARFSLSAMLAAYTALYDELLEGRSWKRQAGPSIGLPKRREQ